MDTLTLNVYIKTNKSPLQAKKYNLRLSNFSKSNIPVNAW